MNQFWHMLGFLQIFLFPGNQFLPLQQKRWTAIPTKWSSILFSAATAAASTATPAPKASAPSATRSRSRRSSSLPPTCRRRCRRRRRRQSPSRSRRVRRPRRQLQSKQLLPQSCFRTRWEIIIFTWVGFPSGIVKDLWQWGFIIEIHSVRWRHLFRTKKDSFLGSSKRSRLSSGQVLPSRADGAPLDPW